MSWENFNYRCSNNHCYYRLQLSFDVKDAQGKSVVPKNKNNTVSRYIHFVPNEQELNIMYWSYMQGLLHHIREDERFRRQFYLDTPKPNEQGYINPLYDIEIPSEFQGYHSVIHSTKDTHLYPYSDTTSWIHFGIVAQIRRALRKTLYFLSGSGVRFRL